MAISALTIPTNIGPTSYTGLGSSWQDFSANTVQPVLANLVSNYPQFMNKTYDDATAGLGKVATAQLQPALQGALNSLAGRNMINSSVASDTMSKAGTGVLNNLLGYGASLQGQKAAALANMPNMLGGIAQLGQYSSSTDNSVPYEIMATLLSGMM